MPRYTVRVRELHESFYTIDADNPEDALKRVSKDGDRIPNSQEYIDLAEPQFWTVTDEGDDPITPVTFAEPIVRWLTKKFPPEYGSDNSDLTEILDGLVHDIASEEASSANNGGVVDQVEYIVRTCGTDAKKTIKNALGEE
jgi:hypothetical protein